jgi:hypothetical protein
MGDAQVRDHLAEERGVLCFEMEAAGAMKEAGAMGGGGKAGGASDRDKKDSTGARAS